GWTRPARIRTLVCTQFAVERRARLVPCGVRTIAPTCAPFAATAAGRPARFAVHRCALVRRFQSSIASVPCVGGATWFPIGCGSLSETVARIGPRAAIRAAPGAPASGVATVEPDGTYCIVAAVMLDTPGPPPDPS